MKLFRSKKDAIRDNPRGKIIVYFRHQKKWRVYSRVSKKMREILFNNDFTQFTEWEQDKTKQYIYEVTL
jgi:hypothetical protein